MAKNWQGLIHLLKSIFFYDRNLWTPKNNLLIKEETTFNYQIPKLLNELHSVGNVQHMYKQKSSKEMKWYLCYDNLNKSTHLSVKSPRWSFSPKGISTSEWSGARYRIRPGRGSGFCWRGRPRSKGFSTCPFTMSSAMSSNTTDPRGRRLRFTATSLPWTERIRGVSF